MLNPDDRILILAPHPDDEVLGCGGVIQRAIEMKLPLQIVFFTYGDSNEWSFLRYRKYPVVLPQQVRRMGLVRHEEAIKATKLLGLSSAQVIFLGYPDFGTLRIWQSRWRSRPPLRSMFTKVRKVPYKNAFRPGAFYKGEEILKDLKTIISDFCPTKIFLSHRHDFNTDHQALYLFTRVALWDLEPQIKPHLYPFLIHFDKWPYPRSYQPVDPLDPPKKLEQVLRWVKHQLTNEEIKTKYTALNAHKTQVSSNRKYLDSFIKTNELFGDYAIISAKDITPYTQIGSGVISTFIPFEELSEKLSEEELSEYLGIKDESISLENNTFSVSITLSGFVPTKGRVLTEKIKRRVDKVRDVVDVVVPDVIADDVYETIDTLLPITKEGALPATVTSILPKSVGVAFYIFGYRYDRPFAEMPKLWVRVGRKGYTFFDLDKQMSQPIEVIREGSKLKVKIPLKLLENPHMLLINVKNYLGIYTLDWVPWRIVRVEY
ncbi:MAG: PIG-L deacetylase family protein [Promethearchaeota archaeon]